MSRDAQQFGEATSKLRDVESHAEDGYLHEYDAVFEENDESVRVITLAPDLVDNDAATDAFKRVSGQWYNANTHQNIVSIVERESTPQPWIAIDQTHDVTLGRAQSQLTPGEIETVVTGTAEALQTLGLYNAVHGTLTPADILVYPDGDDTVIQVKGFGLEHAVRTALGEFEPTPYTAPELLDNPSQATDQTDVYGLGAITYFVLTGKPPVHGANIEQAIRDGPTHPPSEYNDEVDVGLDDAVMQSLSTRSADPQDSPHTFKRAFLSAFDAGAFETEIESGTETDQMDATSGGDEDGESTTGATNRQVAKNEKEKSNKKSPNPSYLTTLRERVGSGVPSLSNVFLPVSRWLFDENGDFVRSVKTKLSEAGMDNNSQLFLARGLAVSVILAIILGLLGSLIGFITVDVLFFGSDPAIQNEIILNFTEIVKIPFLILLTALVFGVIGLGIGFGSFVAIPYFRARARE